MNKDHSKNFDGLAELIKEDAESSGDRDALESFMRSHGPAWAKTDLTQALAWSQTHLKGKNRVEQSAQLFEPAASADFDTALRIWQTLPEGELKIRAAKALSKGAPPERKPHAEAFIHSLPEH